MGAITEITILYRHPDARVRKLQPKVLEYKDPKGETQFFMPETVESARGPQVIYKLPVDFARRVLANQHERYFLVEPAELVVKRKLPGGLSVEFVKVTNKVAADFLAKDNPDEVARKAQEAEAARLERQRLSREEADRKARDEAEAEEKAKKASSEEAEQKRLDDEAAARRAAEDQAALQALETADIGADAPPVEL